MLKYPVLTLGGIVVAAVLSLIPLTASAQADDKTISVAACVPRAPGTTAAELLFVGNGVHNPGVQNEQIICPLPRDSETGWSTENQQDLQIGFKTGAVPGKVACTVYVGSPADSGAGGTLSSVTFNPPQQPANTPYTDYVALMDPIGANSSQAPANVLCTITPKASLAFLNLEEFDDTDDQDTAVMP